MATRLTGALGPFMLQTMQWSSYAEWMEEYLLANRVDDEKASGSILEQSEATYKQLRDLCSLDKPNSKSL